jgi:hypothetical protein
MFVCLFVFHYVIFKIEHRRRKITKTKLGGVFLERSCETMPGPNKHRSGCSQSAIGYKAPNGGARESTQGAKGICNTIGGTTL